MTFHIGESSRVQVVTASSAEDAACQLLAPMTSTIELAVAQRPVLVLDHEFLPLRDHPVARLLQTALDTARRATRRPPDSGLERRRWGCAARQGIDPRAHRWVRQVRRRRCIRFAPRDVLEYPIARQAEAQHRRTGDEQIGARNALR